MPSYSLVWRRSAERELRKLPSDAIVRLIALAESLREDPYPPSARKLVGTQHTFRVRTGDYRLVYTVAGEQLIVEVIRVGHRKDVYR
ncbi:MAG: type II toxin-antitoxin system RelE/ParE family toxin [Gammaproteobacteria bacterium]